MPSKIVLQKSKEMKEKILICAKKSFYQNGFTKTTMRGIGNEIGIPQSLLYYYFENKHAIAHVILDEYYYKISKRFNHYYNSETDTFMYLLLIVRIISREISRNSNDLDFYFKGYEKVYNDKKFDKHVFLCLKKRGMDISEEKVKISTIMANAAWSELVVQMLNKSLSISLWDIRDNIDLLRWSYLGFDQKYIKSKIDESYKILDTIPLMDIPLLEPPSDSTTIEYQPHYSKSFIALNRQKS